LVVAAAVGMKQVEIAVVQVVAVEHLAAAVVVEQVDKEITVVQVVAVHQPMQALAVEVKVQQEKAVFLTQAVQVGLEVTLGHLGYL
jgi:hypothetical protein